MRLLVVLSAVVAALAIAPSASPGGFATVGFEPLPDGTSAGGTWKPTIFVKQHGVTPLRGLQPVIDVYDDQTGAAAKFIATETSEAGVYTADVVFPAQGDWRVTIHSGFGDSQVSYGPVAIGPRERATAARVSFPSPDWVSWRSRCSARPCCSARVVCDG